MVAAYYNLTKPGLMYGNVFVGLAGFLYASTGAIDILLLLCTLLGLACVISAACVCNNYLDRDLDKHMERTKNRALASGHLSNRNALIFAAALFVLGSSLLWFGTTPTAFAVALAGFCIYVFAYTPLKPVTPYALFVGAVAGATPPVIGYTAVTNSLDMTALVFFIFLFVWQLPHFLAIAVYRNDEYVNAKVPLFMTGPYTVKQKKIAKIVFYLSLVVLLVWCFALMVHR